MASLRVCTSLVNCWRMRIAYLCINQYSEGARHEGTDELGTWGAHTRRQTADNVQCSDHLRHTMTVHWVPSHMTFNYNTPYIWWQMQFQYQHPPQDYCYILHVHRLQVTLFMYMQNPGWGWTEVEQKYTVIGTTSFQAPSQLISCIMGGTWLDRGIMCVLVAGKCSQCWKLMLLH